MSVFLEVEFCQRGCDHRLSTAVLEDQVTPHCSKGLHSFPLKVIIWCLQEPERPVPQPTPEELWGQKAMLSRLQDWCLEMRVPRGGESTQGLHCPDKPLA